MNIERLEKIKELTQKIEIILEEYPHDSTSIFIKGKLSEFSKSLNFSMKEELFEEYTKKLTEEKYSKPVGM